MAECLFNSFHNQLARLFVGVGKKDNKLTYTVSCKNIAASQGTGNTVLKPLHSLVKRILGRQLAVASAYGKQTYVYADPRSLCVAYFQLIQMLEYLIFAAP